MPPTGFLIGWVASRISDWGRERLRGGAFAGDFVGGPRDLRSQISDLRHHKDGACGNFAWHFAGALTILRLCPGTLAENIGHCSFLF
jgi:hypothetical protein